MMSYLRQCHVTSDTCEMILLDDCCACFFIALVNEILVQSLVHFHPDVNALVQCSCTQILVQVYQYFKAAVLRFQFSCTEILMCFSVPVFRFHLYPDIYVHMYSDVQMYPDACAPVSRFQQLHPDSQAPLFRFRYTCTQIPVQLYPACRASVPRL